MAGFPPAQPGRWDFIACDEVLPLSCSEHCSELCLCLAFRLVRVEHRSASMPLAPRAKGLARGCGAGSYTSHDYTKTQRTRAPGAAGLPASVPSPSARVRSTSCAHNRIRAVPNAGTNSSVSSCKTRRRKCTEAGVSRVLDTARFEALLRADVARRSSAEQLR